MQQLRWLAKLCNTWCSRRAVCQDEALCARYSNTSTNSGCDACWCFLQKPLLQTKLGTHSRARLWKKNVVSSWGHNMEADQTLKTGLHQRILIFTHWKFIWRHIARGDSLWEDFWNCIFEHEISQYSSLSRASLSRPYILTPSIWWALTFKHAFFFFFFFKMQLSFYIKQKSCTR